MADHNKDLQFFAESMADLVRESLIAIDKTFRVVWTNRSFYKTFKILKNEAEGKLIYELGGGQWDIPDLRELLETVVSSNSTIEGFKVRHTFESIGEKVMLFNAGRFLDEKTNLELIILVIEDITEQETIKRKLDEQTNNFNALLEYIPAGVLVVDKDSVVQNISRYLCELMDTSKEKILNMNTIDRVAALDLYWSDGSRVNKPDDLPTSKAFLTGKSHIDKEMVLRKANVTRNLIVSVAPVKDQSGVITAAVEVFLDITAQKVAMKTNEERRRVLDAIMSYVPAGIMLVDEKARITDVSRELVRIVGVPEEELIGQVEKTEIWGVLEPSTRKPLPFRSMPLYRVINEKKIISDEEYLLVRDGQERVIAISAGPVLDENGNVSGGISIWHDITKRKIGQAAKRESEERFRTLADNISQLAWMANPQGEIFWYNKRWYEYTGYSPEQIKNEDWRNIPHPDYVEKVVSSFRDALKKGTLWEYTFPMRSRDGEYKWFLTRAMPIRDDHGVIVRWFGTCTDISDIRKYQEELQIAAERFNRVISTDIVGIAFADGQGGISYANDYCLNMLEYGREEFENRKLSWIELTPQEFLDNDFKILNEFKMKGAAPSYEKQFIRKDGSRVWVLIAFTILPGPGEQLFCFVLDITERKRALEVAQKRTAEVEAVLNSIPDGLVIIDSDGFILQINNVASDLLDISGKPDKWPLSTLMKNFTPKGADGKLLDINQMPSRRALRGETVRNLIVMFSKPDKNYVISESASPIYSNGKLVGAIMEFSDVTPLHDLQMQLTAERNFIEAIFQSSGALIVVFDRNSQIIRFNRACEILSGYSEQEVVNRSFYPLIPPEEHEKVRKVVSSLFSGETLIENENNWLTKSGEKRYIRWRDTAIIDEQGNMSYYVATGIDITDRRRLEEELNKRAHELTTANTDLESFSYSVSHDLRSPLAAINGLSTMMIEDYAGRLDKDGIDYLHSIHNGTKKMMHLIEDMLSLSKVGRHEMKREDIDLSKMVRKFLEEFRCGSPQREVEFKVQNDVYVYADSHLLYIAVENLLRNAWKFTSKRPLTVIEFGTVVVNSKVTCFIKDNGVGFDPKFAEIIFEPFKRVPGEKEFGGTGVGLSIVKRVIDRHGGKVWAKGKLGDGAVFYFTLS